MQPRKTILGVALVIATLALLLGAAIDLGSLISFGGSFTGNVVGTVVTGSVCYISLSNSVIDFGTIYPASNTITTPNVITVIDSGGNAQATILIAGGTGGASTWYQSGNWLGSSAANTIGITNTVYSNSASTLYGSATQITNTLTSTTYTIAAPTRASPIQSTTIYLGMGVPAATPADVYTTNIVLENSC